MATAATTVTAYIAAQPRSSRAALKKVRAAIRKGAPGAEESISYGMPTYKLGGRAVIYFAGWKDHYSIYPANAELVAAFRTELAPYEVNNKGTIRFPLSDAVPMTLIGRLAAFLLEQMRRAIR
jgi:uncharacterized protein YdhG (YjbR/CyaY superfamily)